MSKRPRHTDEFNNQEVVCGYPVLEINQRLGIANKSLYDWMNRPSSLDTSELPKITIFVGHG